MCVCAKLSTKNRSSTVRRILDNASTAVVTPQIKDTTPELDRINRQLFSIHLDISKKLPTSKWDYNNNISYEQSKRVLDIVTHKT